MATPNIHEDIEITAMRLTPQGERTVLKLKAEFVQDEGEPFVRVSLPDDIRTAHAPDDDSSDFGIEDFEDGVLLDDGDRLEFAADDIERLRDELGIITE